jgi:hypothetical protein
MQPNGWTRVELASQRGVGKIDQWHLDLLLPHETVPYQGTYLIEGVRKGHSAIVALDLKHTDINSLIHPVPPSPNREGATTQKSRL